MIKILISLVMIFMLNVQADILEKKYKLYTEYLGMEVLPLNHNQLKKIVPKLEKKLKQNEYFKKAKLQAELNNLYSGDVEQTICFAREGKYVAKIGDNVSLHAGECLGRTLPQMNKDGWMLTEVVTGLQTSFGMVFTRRR